MKNLIVVLLATLFAIANANTALDEFSDGNLKFTAELYKKVLAAKPNQNFVFSPLSIEIILALLRVGAKGQTENELTTGLFLPNQQKTEEALRELLPALRSNKDDLKLQSANKMFLGEKFEILDSFKKIAVGLFEAGAENVDFAKNVQAANIINQWVEQQTNNKIKDLIDPSLLDGLTRLVLVNALYFSGKWETPFEKYLTSREKFYTSNTQSKEVYMMHVEESFRYYECTRCNAKFLELPYLGGNISMTIVLPNEKEGLGALESNIEEVLAAKQLQYERVAVSLPRFLVESELELKPILKQLGITTMFTEQADLSKISTEPLLVDDVIQKAFINVSESGTEAAAATAVKASARAGKLFVIDPKIFQADHPFIYIIRFNNVILFSGKLAV